MPLPENEFVVTSDGSHTLRSGRFDVAYHSTHGAIQESDHVFIQNGLNDYLATSGRTEVNILEMGFGTGLNALLTQIYVEGNEGLSINFYSFEAYPLAFETVRELNFTELLNEPFEKLTTLHHGPYNGVVYPVHPRFNLAKTQQNLLEGLPDAWARVKFDVVYYDAFAPASQPELWTPEAMKICSDAMREGGFFVTYCAQGQFKRNLRSTGMRIERRPGPPGKREMTRGVKL